MMDHSQIQLVEAAPESTLYQPGWVRAPSTLPTVFDVFIGMLGSHATNRPKDLEELEDMVKDIGDFSPWYTPWNMRPDRIKTLVKDMKPGWKELYHRALKFLGQHAILGLRKRAKKTKGAGLSVTLVNHLPASQQYLVEYLYDGYDGAECQYCGRIKGYVKVEPNDENMKDIRRKAKCENCEANQVSGTQSALRHIVQVRNGRLHQCLWDTENCVYCFSSLSHLLYH
jgi:hypothetical protein